MESQFILPIHESRRLAAAAAIVPVVPIRAEFFIN